MYLLLMAHVAVCVRPWRLYVQHGTVYIITSQSRIQYRNLLVYHVTSVCCVSCDFCLLQESPWQGHIFQIGPHVCDECEGVCQRSVSGSEYSSQALNIIVKHDTMYRFSDCTNLITSVHCKSCNWLYRLYVTVWSNWGYQGYTQPKLCGEIHHRLLLWTVTEALIWNVCWTFD